MVDAWAGRISAGREAPGASSLCTGSRVMMTTRVTVLWRRLLVLLIGGVIAVPYFAVVIWAVTASNQVARRTESLIIIATGAVVFLLLCIPAFLTVIRAVERTLSEQLLELTIPVPPRRPRTADRLRGALFYFGHVVAEGYFLPHYALILLGPSPADRAELAGRERARRSRRTVLAGRCPRTASDRARGRDEFASARLGAGAVSVDHRR